MGLILESMRKSGRFFDLHTESIQGDIQPSEDKYAGVKAESDPIFAIWGKRK